MIQVELVKKHLERGLSITPREALDFYGCFRLSGVIFKLKREPYKLDIKKETVALEKKHFARYSLRTKLEPSGQRTLCV